MPAPVPLYQTLLDKLTDLTAGRGVRLTSLRRLALLVAGIIDARSCVLAQVVDWPTLAGTKRQVVIATDETSRGERTHLFRLSLSYWGGAIPLAWTTWAQNVALPPGAYWAAVDGVFQRLRALLPGGLSVVVVADRAYDIPAFVDRLGAQGWHWVVRCKAKSSLRFRDR